MRVVLPLKSGLPGLVNLHDASRDRLTDPRLHAHDELEFNLVVSGQARVLIDGRWVSLHPGDLLWLFPGQEHMLMEQDERFSMWVVVFRPAVVEAQAQALGDPRLAEADPVGIWHRRLGPETAGRLADQCERLTMGDLSDHAQRQGFAWLLLIAWADAARGDAGEEGLRLSPAVERAVQLLQRRDAPERLADLSRRCGLSPARLSRCFHAEVGQTIGAYRDRQRLQRFFDVWNGGSGSVTKSAFAAGFGSYTRFYTVFRRLTGRSPRSLLVQRDSA